jgi:hypothetical protein
MLGPGTRESILLGRQLQVSTRWLRPDAGGEGRCRYQRTPLGHPLWRNTRPHPRCVAHRAGGTRHVTGYRRGVSTGSARDSTSAIPTSMYRPSWRSSSRALRSFRIPHCQVQSATIRTTTSFSPAPSHPARTSSSGATRNCARYLAMKASTYSRPGSSRTNGYDARTLLYVGG